MTPQAPHSIFSRLLSVLLAAVTTLTCAHPATLSASSHDVLYVFAESRTLFVVDAATGGVVATPPLSVPQVTSPVLSSDSSTLYFTSEDSVDGGILALDAHTLAVRRILNRKRLGWRSDDSLKMYGVFLATAPGRGELFDGSGMVHDRPHGFPEWTQRIVAIDTASGAVTSASSALSILSMRPFPAGVVAPKGALIILSFGTSRAQDSLGSLMLFDPEAREALGPFTIPRFMPGTEPSTTKLNATEIVRSVVPSPDGRRVYLLAWKSVFGFDLLTRKLFAVIHAPSYDGHLAASPDGSRVYFVEDKLSPGIQQLVSRSGTAPRMPLIQPPSRIRTFDASLVEGRSIPFGAQFTPDSPATRPLSIVVSRDNASLYLTADKPGAERKRQLHVLVMNVATGKIVHDVALEADGGGTILVGH